MSYRIGYADELLSYLAQGKTEADFAKAKKVSVNVLHDWALTIPEFRAAMAKALAMKEDQEITRRGRPAKIDGASIFGASIKHHEMRCPKYRIIPCVEFGSIIGRCNRCGMEIERYPRSKRKKHKNLWESLQDD